MLKHRKKKQPLKLFVIKKYVMAKSAADAIRRDKLTPVDDVWIDDDFRKANMNTVYAIGFSHPPIDNGIDL